MPLLIISHTQPFWEIDLHLIYKCEGFDNRLLVRDLSKRDRIVVERFIVYILNFKRVEKVENKGLYTQIGQNNYN